MEAKKLCKFLLEYQSILLSYVGILSSYQDFKSPNHSQLVSQLIKPPNLIFISANILHLVVVGSPMPLIYYIWSSS